VSAALRETVVLETEAKYRHLYPVRARSARAEAIESGYATWVRALFPTYVVAPFAPRHDALWAWAWGIGPEDHPRPFVAIWPRGGAKSTTAELAAVMLGARAARRYALYVCETQEQADDHVGTIAALLETAALAEAYPAMADRLVGKYGASKGWRRNRVRTASGFTVDAIGLDTATRGVKLEDARPDLLILDDIDGGLDSPATTAKKVKTITRALLPAGAANLAVLAVQNQILPDGVFAQLADGRADFLVERIVSGPHPAVRNLATNQVRQDDGRTRYVIIDGEATWAGQSLAVCERQINEWGLSAFLSEAQHDVQEAGGGMFDHLDYRHCAHAAVPALVRTTVWCDPAVTDTDESDSHGIQADGIAADGTIYRLWSWEGRTSPEDAQGREVDPGQSAALRRGEGGAGPRPQGAPGGADAARLRARRDRPRGRDTRDAGTGAAALPARQAVRSGRCLLLVLVGLAPAETPPDPLGWHRAVRPVARRRMPCRPSSTP
jgi:hypothetical protein